MTESAHISRKEPLMRIAKRKELSRPQAILLRLGALLLALAAGGVFMLVLGANPLDVYASILKGAFVGSQRNPYSSIQMTIKMTIPLLISSIGLAFAFKLKFWNIGAEGQIIMGAIFASYFALYCDGMPHIALVAVMLMAGMVGGGLWALIPALFKVKWNTNETLFTLMMNYIALYIILYLTEGPWKDPAQPGFAAIPRFAANARLGKVFGVHIGWIIALILVVLALFYLFFTKQGYEISVVGESPATARYAGMNVRWIVLRTMFISGAVCGLAGMLQATGSDYTLSEGVAGGTGFTAITVTWLSKLNPLMIALVSFLFSVLDKGSTFMQNEFKISSNAADVLQGILLFFVLGCEFFIRYAVVFRTKRRESVG